MVEAMGGSISARSTPGQGSRFSVELAVAPSPNPPLRVAAEGLEPGLRPSIRAGETQAVVLYIDDNLANFSLVQNVLRHRSEIKLLAAMQGRIGVELAQKHRPDLILLDFHLPDISGDEVLARLHHNPATRHIPVIVVSADATAPQTERMRALGAKQYLTKPLDVRQFLETLDASLEMLDTSS